MLFYFYIDFQKLIDFVVHLTKIWLKNIDYRGVGDKPL